MKPLPPGSCIGFLGGGQLARMMAMEALKLGYRVGVLDPDPNGPGAQLADRFVQGNWNDVAAAEKLAASCDVLTLDTEHVPASLLKKVDAIAPVRPSPKVLETIQDRLTQRNFLQSLGVPQTPFAPVGSVAELEALTLPYPCVLKTRTSGYDGKGQVRVDSPDALGEGWERLNRQPAVAEAYVDLAKEISVLLCRSLTGEIVFYPIAENVHRNHILHTTTAPADIAPAMVTKAQELGRTIAEALAHVGMLAVELFVTREGKLLVNELAPRTHNSGHFSFGGSETSQFEQHVRAIVGLPLGSTRSSGTAILLNLLGDLWADGEPNWSSVLSHPEAHLHLYGKQDARPGRKMGHVLVLAQDPERARAVIQQIEEELGLA